MHSEQEIVQQLSAAGFRITQARRAIIQVLLSAQDCLTPADVYERARLLSPNVGLVTAYRTLELLSDMGVVRKIHGDADCHGYAIIGHGHRHHLTCRRCGRVEEFEGCSLSELFERVRLESGFAIVDHMLEVTGICPDCQSLEHQAG
jgi:Fur family transcriptional regulator, ferric uptake regulator